VSIKRYEDMNRVRKSFRLLRLLYIDGKARHMFNYFRLRRWLQICARFRYLLRAMPVFHTLKRKWTSFNRWVGFLEWMRMTRTKGLSQKFRRRRVLLAGFAQVLQGERLIGMHYNHTFLNKITTSRRCIFFRWVRYCQRRVAFRHLSRNARMLRRWRLLRRVLSIWKTGMTPAQSYPFRRLAPIPFGEKRVLADLGVLRCWVLAGERTSLARRILIKNRRHKRKLKKSVVGNASFKKAVADYEEEVRLPAVLMRRVDLLLVLILKYHSGSWRSALSSRGRCSSMPSASGGAWTTRTMRSPPRLSSRSSWARGLILGTWPVSAPLLRPQHKGSIKTDMTCPLQGSTENNMTCLPWKLNQN
jgi:hypothetical protein